jgi:hypothetical protein
LFPQFYFGGKVYEGYTNHERNTDHAWLETQTFHLHIKMREEDEKKGNQFCHARSADADIL